MSGPISGLGTQHRAQARRIVLLGCQLLLAHPERVHYTMKAPRWQGIDQQLLVMKGQCITYGDCSSTATWLLWNALAHHFHFQDHVNGEHWRAGYTGTLAQHGKPIHYEDNLKVADLIFYGPAPEFEHVAVYIGGGMVMSHGSESGPYKLRMRYRDDFAQARRYL